MKCLVPYLCTLRPIKNIAFLLLMLVLFFWHTLPAVSKGCLHDVLSVWSLVDRMQSQGFYQTFFTVYRQYLFTPWPCHRVGLINVAERCGFSTLVCTRRVCVYCVLVDHKNDLLLAFDFQGTSKAKIAISSIKLSIISMGLVFYCVYRSPSDAHIPVARLNRCSVKIQTFKCKRSFEMVFALARCFLL